ncbi:MAG: hypothetical protein R2825_16300 [Saprospiraceae bacterium]
MKKFFKPQNHYQALPEPFQNEFTSCGFGWWLTLKMAIRLSLSEGIDGATANLMMVEDLDFGVIVLSNASELAPLY